MKIILYLCCFSLILTSASAQKEDHIWMMGYDSSPQDSIHSNMVIDFNENPLSVTQLYQDFSFYLTNSIISTPEGELACYSNGVEIRNSNHEVIINGEEFQSSSAYSNGYPMTHGALFLPMPDVLDQYIYLLGDLVFFEYEGWLRPGISPLTYSYINMNSNGGIGEVIEKKSIICNDTLSSGLLTATRHANGRDWWVILNKNETNQYYSFLINPNGISNNGLQTIGDTLRNGLAQANFSLDGSWYAQYNWSGVTSISTDVYIDLYQFDRCTGLLSNHLQIKDEGAAAPGGVSFSPNSRFMYISSWDKIYQFDLESSDIEASRDTVAVYDGFEAPNGSVMYQTRFYLMQNAPDGKIYISCPNTNSRYLHVIDQPDSAGIACSVLQHHVELPSFNLFGLPNLPNFRLGTLDGSPCDTLKPIAAFSHSNNMLEVSFEDMSTRNPDSWHWDFGDFVTSDEQHPVHTYSVSGTYEVCLNVSNGIGSDSVCQEVVLIVDELLDVDAGIEIKIQPNPAIDELYIYFSSPLQSNYFLNLYSSTGMPLLKEYLGAGINHFNTSITHLPEGIYFYKVEDNNKQVIASGKIVISR